MTQSQMLASYRNMISDLVGDGWNATDDPRATHLGNTARVYLTCPTDYLRMTLEVSGNGAVGCRLGIEPGGCGEPARWRASATDAPAQLWLAAARAAHLAAAGTDIINVFPGDVLVQQGWKPLHTQLETTIICTNYTCPHGAVRLSYRPSQRAIPALWSISRPRARIGVLVSTPEPRALPTLVLALALTTIPQGNDPSR